MKKIYIIIASLLVVVISAYLYVRYSFLKTDEIKADPSKARSALDLRPQIIAKLQELVKKGSGGLYNLSIDKIQPHVILSKLDMQDAVLTPDTAVLMKL